MRIVNIVATAKVEEQFDLALLSQRIPEAELPSNGAPWLKMRLQPEGHYTAFYKSGKFLITGLSSFDAIDLFVERILGRLSQGGIETHVTSITIHNIVLTDEVNLTTTLENLVESLDNPRMCYEPEQFPGLIYKDDDGISYFVFSSGKMVVTGVTDIDSAKINVERFKALIT